MKSGIDIYCESAPIEGYPAYGLSQAIIPILSSLDEQTDNILIFACDGIFSKDQIPLKFRSKLKILGNYIASLANRLEKKAPWLGDALFTISCYICLASTESSRNKLVAVIGANHGALRRAAKLATIWNRKLYTYFVDDVIPPTLPADVQARNREQVMKIAQNISGAIAITKGLAERLHHHFGIQCAVANLPYDSPAKIPESPAKNQIIYVGAMNFLYVDTIRYVFELLKAHNASAPDPITFRFTTNQISLRLALGKTPEWVICNPISERDELLAEIAASRCALMPYSFNTTVRTMVESSFPSKLLDYLAVAKRILVVAPKYSSIANYFSDFPEVTIHDLDIRIDQILIDSPHQIRELRLLYRRILNARHSTDAFQTTLMDQLNKTDADL